MRFALSSIKEDADCATTTPYATCGTSVAATVPTQEWPPLCVCFDLSLISAPPTCRGRLQTEKCMRHMHKVWTVNCINGHSFCSAEWVYSSYARIRIRIRSSHSGMSNGATFNWMNKRHLIELRLCSQCVSLAPTAFIHMYSYEYVCMYMSVLGESDIYAECWRLFRLLCGLTGGILKCTLNFIHWVICISMGKAWKCESALRVLHRLKFFKEQQIQ